MLTSFPGSPTLDPTLRDERRLGTMTDHYAVRASERAGS